MDQDPNERKPSAGTQAETAGLILNDLDTGGGNAMYESPNELSSFDVRLRMAQQIVNYEARRDDKAI